MNRWFFLNAVMLSAFLVTASAPVVAQQRHFSGVHIPIVTANDPIDPNPVPPPPDPGTTGFALHS